MWPSSIAAFRSLQSSSAFVPCPKRDLQRVFSVQFERTVNRDNTVSFQNLTLQIEPVKWRGTLAGGGVIAHQHLDGTLSLSHGPHHLGRYDAAGEPLPPRASPELSRGRGTAPFPCNPIPKINPAVEARLAPLNPKPDLSLATKSGHFDLLRTPRSQSSAHNGARWVHAES